MGARCYPQVMEQVDGRRGEWQVWDQLRRELPDECTLLHGVRVPSGPDGRELDLVVLWPGVGIGVVEVKGGTVSCDDDDRWWSSRGAARTRIGNPMEQVQTARHELHRLLDERRLPAARARTQHLVVLPHTSIPQDFDPTSCPRA
ncbi:MAG: nuclease-related domain-containing protein, partial [Mycobacteriales bacterium]